MTPKMRHLFLKWLDMNRHRFAIPITVAKRTKGCVDIAFTGINPVISAHVREQGQDCSLSVFVSRKGDPHDCLDIILDLECMAAKTDGGYICSECEIEKWKKFADLKSLLEDHLFEPFLNWVNNELATAQYIGLWEQGGSSAAKLIKPTPVASDSWYQLFPLRTEGENSLSQVRS